MRIIMRKPLTSCISVFGFLAPALLFTAFGVTKVRSQASRELVEMALVTALYARWTTLEDSLPVNACSVYFGLRTDSLVTDELRKLVPPLDQTTASRCGRREERVPGSVGSVRVDSVSLIDAGQKAVVHLGISRRGGASFSERHHLRRLFPPPSRLMWGHDSIVIGLVVYR
jgi:hypothetical protein